MSHPLLGQTLASRYRFEALLGEGTFAHVFRVTDLHRRAALAAKVVRSDIARDPALLERFKREAAVLTRLQHPHIVRCYDIVDVQSIVFILTDYIPGLTLHTVLAARAEPLKPLAALTYLAPLASALHFAHHEGIIHRDLKPTNILLHENGTLYVSDFGIARILGDASTLTHGTTFGTPLYMSPEQFTGQPLTVATDLYALGVMLYEILTGQVPFRGDRRESSGATPSARVAYEHVHLPPIPPAHLSPAVQEVVLRCLEKDPARRFPSASALYDALAEAVGAPPHSFGSPPSPDLKPPEWSQFVAPVPSASTSPAVEKEPPSTRPHLQKELERSAAQTIPALDRIVPAALPTLTRQALPHPQPPQTVHPPTPIRQQRRLPRARQLVILLLLGFAFFTALIYAILTLGGL